MPAISATAPGKIILFGEHAVVYGRPALAVPVQQVRARCIVTAEPTSPSGLVRIQAPGIDLDADLDELSDNHPIKEAVILLMAAVNVSRLPACTLRISSTIPIASGMGSGAAVSIAILRSLSTFLGHPLPDEHVNQLAYEVEKIYHGTPSGIDNTVITFGKPVFFQRGKAEESPTSDVFQAVQAFSLIIADTGVTSHTAMVVGDLHKRWLANRDYFERIFNEIGEIVQKAHRLIETVSPSQTTFLKDLGGLMDQNHELLVKLDVSSPELESLVNAARQTGAFGAKLSGAGRGGNMIALVSPDQVEPITRVLQTAGARNILLTTIG